jgi:glycosyltransferase involved in cell wall biosynthesis
MGMLSKTGVKGILYKFFRAKEKKLYALSDYIGCMSPANVEYVLKHNPEISVDRVEVAPNSLELRVCKSPSKGDLQKDDASPKFQVPSTKNLPESLMDAFCVGKPVFIYGGNLGVPQGIPFLIECLEANADRDDCHFVVVGSGTYYQRLADWYEVHKPKAVSVMKGLPKEDYDRLVQACQVGLIFLDYRFTIPNFPSRLLSYLESKMPVIACTDPNCDTGTIAEVNGFGFYAPSNDVTAFTQAVDKMLSSDMVSMGENGYQFLKENYLIEHTYNQIIKHF